jgi:chromosome segregation ATPase
MRQIAFPLPQFPLDDFYRKRIISPVLSAKKAPHNLLFPSQLIWYLVLPMLDERILLLEGKVVTLLNELKRLRQENAAQKADIQSLTEQANRIPGLEEDIALHKMSVEELTEKANRIPELEEIIATLTSRAETLQQRVQELEQETASNQTKEEEIRERLRNIIEQIDALENQPEEQQQ